MRARVEKVDVLGWNKSDMVAALPPEEPAETATYQDTYQDPSISVMTTSAPMNDPVEFFCRCYLRGKSRR